MFWVFGIGQHLGSIHSSKQHDPVIFEFSGPKMKTTFYRILYLLNFWCFVKHWKFCVFLDFSQSEEILYCYINWANGPIGFNKKSFFMYFGSLRLNPPSDLQNKFILTMIWAKIENIVFLRTSEEFEYWTYFLID